MFQKLIGKRKKESDFFHIPQKKYTCDQKIISKMSTGALKDLFNDQEKYVTTLIEKLEQAKIEYDRLTDKVDELQEKNEVVNGQIARMTNEHEQLAIKFDNLQTSLEIMSSENDHLFKKEVAFLNEQEVNCDKIKNLNAVLTAYREKVVLCKKIQQQNRTLKGRYSEMEEALEQAQERIKSFEKDKNYNSLIPTLMQEIQQLRENNAKAENKKQEDLQNHLSQLQDKIVHKVKNEFQTASTLEEELEERSKQVTLELQKATDDLLHQKERVKQLEQKYQDLIFNHGKNTERISFLEKELAQSTNALSKSQQEIVQIRSKYQAAQETITKISANNKKLEEQLIEQKASGNNLQGFLAEINTVLESKQIECSKLHEELQIKEEIIQTKQEQLNREKENRESVEKLLSSKENSETEGLMKIKARNEAEIQELRHSIDSLKRTSFDNQTRLKQLNDEAELLRTSNKRSTDELQGQKSTNKRLSDELQSLKASSKRLNDECDALRSLNKRFTDEISQFKSDHKRLIEENEQTKSSNKRLNEEIEQLRSSNKRLTEQKLMIQENANNCLKISQQESERIKTIEKEASRKCEEFKKELDAATAKLKLKEDQIRNLTNETEKLFKTLQGKEAELKKSYASIQQLEKDKNNANVMIGEKEEDNKIRIRKYESELNQERIKLESLNRKIGNLQTKAEENKVSMDNMYEQLLSKDKKIVHMETKLKEYKYIIQVLKKEKQDLEESYEKTISTMKPAEFPKVESMEDVKKVKEVEQQVDHEKDNLKNQILSIKEQNIVLLSQNEGLRRKIEELEDTIQQKSRNIKILQQKRDQIMKQIQKMNKRPSNANEQPGLQNLPSPSTVSRIESKDHQSREKKIAAKAHKGFDILLKLEHQFYKNFINIFAVELNRQEVKSIEGQINGIIKKSSDMRDIFEDYL